MPTTRHQPAAPNRARETMARGVDPMKGSSAVMKPGALAMNRKAPAQDAKRASRRMAVRKRMSVARAKPATKKRRYDQRCQPA